MTRSRVTSDTGLTSMTVHRLIVALRRRGLVVSAGESDRGRVGRPSSLFRFNASIGHVVGIDVGNETTRTVLTLLDGTPMARLESSRPRSRLISSMVSASNLHDLQSDAGVPPDALVAVGVGVPAITPLTEPSCELRSTHDGMALGGDLSSVLGRQVLVTQDDQLARAACRGACVGIRNAVVLDIGKGVGVGIVVGGSVYTGNRSAAGRVAWNKVPGERAMEEWVQLGSLLTADGLLADYGRYGGSPGSHGAVDVFHADALGDAARLGRSICLRIDLAGGDPRRWSRSSTLSGS